jgi:anionic cell wall polymer biosynthesis LytR-Cps2A-Psr (LCP) family protein
MKGLRSFSGKIIIIAFAVSIISAVLSMFLLFSTQARQTAKTSAIWERAQSHTQAKPEKTTFNILLLGYGGGNHSGGGLSDALVLANVNTTTKNVNIIAIPRDTWVELPVRSDLKESHKINAAFAIGNDDRGYPLKEPEYKGSDGGDKMAKYAVEKVTGLTVDYYAAVDFGSFERAIDVLGGITVDVPVTFDDYFYPVKGLENELCGMTPERITEVHALYSGFELEKQFTCRYEHLHFENGEQKMDGPTALKFIRSRHSDQHGGDFARGQRQQAVLTAVRNKFLSLDAINKIDEFFKEFSGLIKTDIKEMDVVEILSHTGNPLDYTPKNINIDTNNYLQNSTSADGQYILIPKAGLDNWEEIHQFLNNEIGK